MHTGSGYEHNIFNAPAFLEDNDTLQLVSSAAFQFTKLQISGAYQHQKHQFKWSGKTSYAMFPSEASANVWETRLDGRYVWKLHPKIQLSLLGQWRSKKNGGSVDISSDIVVPRSYQQRQHLLKYQWQPAKCYQTTLQAYRTHKSYAATAQSELMYDETGVRLASIYKHKQKNKKWAQWEMQAAFYQRQYEQYKWELETEMFYDELEEEWIEAEEVTDEEITERLWRYWELGTSYRFYLSPRSRLQISAATQHRIDVWDDRLGYRQMSSAVEWSLKRKSWSFKWKNSYTYRHFSTVLADVEEDIPLQYHYLRTNLSLAYQLNEKWTLQTNAGAVKRWSNTNRLDRRSYRSFFNTNLSIGVIYQWSNKK